MRKHNNIRVKTNHIEDDDKIKEIINKMFIYGFYSTSVEFPVASTESGSSDIDLKIPFEEISQKSIKNAEDFLSSTASAEYIEDFHTNRKIGLENFFDIGLLLKDNNFDLLADELDFKLIIPKNCDKFTLASMCNLAFRFGMSTTKFSGNLTSDSSYVGNRIYFTLSGTPCIELEEDDKFTVVKIDGLGHDLEKFISDFCSDFPYASYNYPWRHVIEDMIDSFDLKNYDGQIAYANKLSHMNKEKITAAIDLCPRTKSEDENIEYLNYKEDKLIHEKTFDIDWEVSDFKKTISDFIKNHASGMDDLQIKAAVSEDINIRSDLKKWVEEEFKAIGIETNIDLICSYKPGYSWIDEIIIPKLKKSKVDRIDILFKPYMPEGKKDWSTEESGVLPAYHNFGTSDDNNWYDSPIRFLQELYPIDDVIEKKLGINKNKVQLLKSDFSERNTYIFIAYDENDKILLKESYEAEVYEIPYLSKFEDMGYVHPTTGYVKIYENEKQIFNKRIKTDVDKIWEIVQNDLLDDLEKYMESINLDNIDDFSKPLFSKLEFDIEVSEPDFRIGIREDMISSLDGLHEDIYFVLSDYFQNYGRLKYGHPFEAPGLILPKISNKKGKPKFSIRLYNKLSDGPFFKIGEKNILTDIYENDDKEIYIKKIGYIDGNLSYDFNVDIKDEELVKEYFKLLQANALDINEKLNFTGYLTSSNNKTALVKNEKEIKHINTEEENKRILEGVDFKFDEIIGYDEYIEIIDELKKISNIEVYQVGKSFQGRKIYAIDFISDKEKGFKSKLKQISLNPSQFINCRHHANEVSSTNAAFKIIHDLLKNKSCKEIIDNINLTIMPLENVDGAALHYELQEENPNWKLHVARFNSLGREFFYDVFNRNTIHVEAIATRRIFEQWLPDIIVDNHGVPSHEWEQQFSGYTSPSFKGFWLPRSILYGYFWPPKDQKFSGNKILCEKMQELVSSAISRENSLKDLNLEWAERFEKYAHKWMPNLFPANYYNDMIFYWINREYCQNQKYFSHRYPWINTVYFTSEVADETAQGEYLELCAYAHYCHNMEILNLIKKTTSYYDYEYDLSKNNMFLNLTRHRPITA